MKIRCKQLKLRSRATIALLSGYWVLSVIAFPQAEKPPRQLSSSALSRTVIYMHKIMSPGAAMAQSLVEGRGKVIAVTPEKQQIVLEHGEIKGFMDAMTMGYKVDSTSLLKGLKPGDEVRFSIDPKKSTIVKIGKAEK